MGGTPRCWIHIIIYNYLMCQFPSENAQTPVIPFKYPASRFSFPLEPSPQLDQLESDRIQLDNVRTFGFFGLDVLLPQLISS